MKSIENEERTISSIKIDVRCVMEALLTFTSKLHQLSYESVSMFYDRYLQECNAWFEAGNSFVESEIVIEDGEYDEIDESNPTMAIKS